MMNNQGVAVVSLDEFNRRLAENPQDAMNWLIMLVGHETIHLNNARNKSGLSRLDDEAAAWQETYKCAVALGMSPDFVTAKKKVSLAHDLLVSNKEKICGLMGIDENSFSKLGYAPILNGNMIEVKGDFVGIGVRDEYNPSNSKVIWINTATGDISDLAPIKKTE